MPSLVGSEMCIRDRSNIASGIILANQSGRTLKIGSTIRARITAVSLGKAQAMGKIIAGDGATFHRVTFDALTFYPKLQEIIYGELVDVTDFGAFVRIGPTDALLHLSQVMDDYLKSNIASGVILANQSGRTLKIGSTIRTRITACLLYTSPSPRD